MRWRMKDPPNLAMRWRIAGGYDALTHTQRCALVTTSTSWDQQVVAFAWPRNPLKQRTSLQGSREPSRDLCSTNGMDFSARFT